MNTNRFWGSITIPTAQGMGNQSQSMIGRMSTISSVSSISNQLSSSIKFHNINPETLSAAATIKSAEDIGNRIDASADSITGSIGAMNQNISSGLENVQKSIGINTLVNAAGFAVVSGAVFALKGEIKKNTEVISSHLQSMEKCFEKHILNLTWQVERQEKWLKEIRDLLANSRSNECNQLVTQGEQNFDNGFYEEAEDRFRLALEYDNTNPMVHYQLGMINVYADKPDVALKHFQKAAVFTPKDQGKLLSTMFRALARIQFANDDYAIALESIEKAVMNYPSEEVLFDRILYCLANGKTESLEKNINELLNKNPGYYYMFLYSDEHREYAALWLPVLEKRFAEVKEEAQKTVKELEVMMKDENTTSALSIMFKKEAGRDPISELEKVLNELKSAVHEERFDGMNTGVNTLKKLHAYISEQLTTFFQKRKRELWRITSTHLPDKESVLSETTVPVTSIVGVFFLSVIVSLFLCIFALLIFFALLPFFGISRVFEVFGAGLLVAFIGLPVAVVFFMGRFIKGKKEKIAKYIISGIKEKINEKDEAELRLAQELETIKKARWFIQPETKDSTLDDEDDNCNKQNSVSECPFCLTEIQVGDNECSNCKSE